MPLKVCDLCGTEWFGRWRNTPNVCEDCLIRAAARVCPDCLRPHSLERDPAQLDAFPVSAMGKDERVPPVLTEYVRPPRSARRAVQLRNPFH